MRNLMLLSAILALAACSDNQQSTAPASSKAVSSRSSLASDGPSTLGLGVPQAKPIDQVGFTKTLVVNTGTVGFYAGQSGSVTAVCPADWQLVSGGYVLSGDILHLALDINGPNATNGWVIHGSVSATGSFVSLSARAICVQ
jgi:hypothetical protein